MKFSVSKKKTTLLRLGKFTHVFFQTREISFPVHKYVFMHINDVIAYNTTKIKKVEKIIVEKIMFSL